MKVSRNIGRPLAIFVCFAVGAWLLGMLVPEGRAVFGTWSLVKAVLFGFCMGLLMKALLLTQLATEIDVIPQTPEEFAGGEGLLRTRLVAPIPDVSAVSTTGRSGPPPKLDFQQLEAATRELCGLGFTPKHEGALQTNRKLHVRMFVRMFEHPSGAFAELYQMFPRGRAALPFSIAIFAYYPDGWVVAETSQQPNWLTWLVRRPRVLGKGYGHGTGIRAMWENHLARRTKVERELGIQPQPHDVAAHIALSRETLRWMRRMVVRRSLFVAMVQSRFFRPENREWWGEYYKFAKS